MTTDGLSAVDNEPTKSDWVKFWIWLALTLVGFGIQIHRIIELRREIKLLDQQAATFENMRRARTLKCSNCHLAEGDYLSGNRLLCKTCYEVSA